MREEVGEAAREMGSSGDLAEVASLMDEDDGDICTPKSEPSTDDDEPLE